MGIGERLYQKQLEETREMVQNPTWYLEFDYIQKLNIIGRTALSGLGIADKSVVHQAKDGVYRVFADLLEENSVPLGEKGQSAPDEQRQPIDKVIIHHTKRDGISKKHLNGMELVRLYVPVYADLKEGDPEFHKPIYSGHFHDGKQVFWPYHYLIEENGDVNELLNHSEIAWHSNNWDMNTQSIALAFNQNLEHRRPSDEALVSAARIIIELAEKHPSFVPSQTTILGHKEVSPDYPRKVGKVIQIQEKCPGKEFLGPGGWKTDLLNEVAA